MIGPMDPTSGRGEGEDRTDEREGPRAEDAGRPRPEAPRHRGQQERPMSRVSASSGAAANRNPRAARPGSRPARTSRRSATRSRRLSATRDPLLDQPRDGQIGMASRGPNSATRTGSRMAAPPNPATAATMLAAKAAVTSSTTSGRSSMTGSAIGIGQAREGDAAGRSAAVTTWSRSMIVVTGPTPPGTGVMAATTGCTARSRRRRPPRPG